MIDSSTLASAIQTQIADTVEKSVEQYVENIVRALAMDDAWIQKMEQRINDSVARRFGQQLSSIDITSLAMQAIEPAVNLYFERQKTAGGGLLDLAHTTQVTIQDDSVTVDKKITTKDLSVTGDAEVEQTLTVRNLAVKGVINTDNKTWQDLSSNIAQQTQERLTQEWRESVVQSVVDLIKKDGIAFDRVKVGDSTLIEGDSLCGNIRRSGLTQLGTLETLQVSGTADLSGSLSVRPRRVGINTEHPEMALAIWDEEVSLVFGKQKDQTAYIGTLRPQNLVIGVNRSAAIDITDQGHVTINHLTVGRHRICHEPECPNYSGTKGDIVFNSNPKNDGVWGWQCLGAFRWVPLRTA